MTDKEKEILKNFEETLPLLTEDQKARLLGFGEGMKFKAQQNKEKITLVK